MTCMRCRKLAVDKNPAQSADDVTAFLKTEKAAFDSIRDIATSQEELIFTPNILDKVGLRFDI